MKNKRGTIHEKRTLRFPTKPKKGRERTKASSPGNHGKVVGSKTKKRGGDSMVGGGRHIAW